jgi:hypothetical protein
MEGSLIPKCLNAIANEYSPTQRAEIQYELNIESITIYNGPKPPQISALRDPLGPKSFPQVPSAYQTNRKV